VRGRGGHQKFCLILLFKKIKIKILNEWVGFFETFGLQLISSPLKVGLKKKPQMPQPTSSITICVKFQQIFSFKAICLGFKLP